MSIQEWKDVTVSFTADLTGWNELSAVSYVDGVDNGSLFVSSSCSCGQAWGSTLPPPACPVHSGALAQAQSSPTPLIFTTPNTLGSNNIFDWEEYFHSLPCPKCNKSIVEFEKMGIDSCVCSLRAQVAKAQEILDNVDAIENAKRQKIIDELMEIANG